VKITASRRDRCAKCAGYIEVGDSVEYFPAVEGRAPAVVEHIGECPVKTPTRNQNAAPQVDAEELFTFRECDDCGHEWAVRRGDRLANVARFTCPPRTSCARRWEGR
jgi:hypothetical protein